MGGVTKSCSGAENRPSARNMEKKNGVDKDKKENDFVDQVDLESDIPDDKKSILDDSEEESAENGEKIITVKKLKL